MSYILITYKNNKFNYKFNINIDHNKEINTEIVEIINHTIYEEIPLPIINYIINNNYQYWFYDEPIHFIINNKPINLEKLGDYIEHPINEKILININPYSNKKILMKILNKHKTQTTNLIDNINDNNIDYYYYNF